MAQLVWNDPYLLEKIFDNCEYRDVRSFYIANTPQVRRVVNKTLVCKAGNATKIGLAKSQAFYYPSYNEMKSLEDTNCLEFHKLAFEIHNMEEFEFEPTLRKVIILLNHPPLLCQKMRRLSRLEDYTEICAVSNYIMRGLLLPNSLTSCSLGSVSIGAINSLPRSLNFIHLANVSSFPSAPVVDLTSFHSLKGFSIEADTNKPLTLKVPKGIQRVSCGLTMEEFINQNSLELLMSLREFEFENSVFVNGRFTYSGPISDKVTEVIATHFLKESSSAELSNYTSEMIPLLLNMTGLGVSSVQELPIEIMMLKKLQILKYNGPCLIEIPDSLTELTAHRVSHLLDFKNLVSFSTKNIIDVEANCEMSDIYDFRMRADLTKMHTFRISSATNMHRFSYSRTKNDVRLLNNGVAGIDPRIVGEITDVSVSHYEDCKGMKNLKHMLIASKMHDDVNLDEFPLLTTFVGRRSSVSGTSATIKSISCKIILSECKFLSLTALHCTELRTKLTAFPSLTSLVCVKKSIDNDEIFMLVKNHVNFNIRCTFTRDLFEFINLYANTREDELMLQRSLKSSCTFACSVLGYHVTF